MKIFIFGCSWSSGVRRQFSIAQPAGGSAPCSVDYASWARELATMFPEYSITNYALSSSDLPFSIALLNNVIHQKIYDKLIFQITLPYRFTYWNDIDFDIYLESSNNYSLLSEKVRDDVTTLNVHDVEGTSKKDREFISEYLKIVNHQREISVFKSLVSYAEHHTDLCFSHEYRDYLDNLAIETELGNEKFHNYICDTGMHFGDAGNKWQAEWVANRLNL